MKRDLTYFNSRWWYRLLKVIFIFLFGISVLLVGYVTYVHNRPRMQQDYIVTCNYGTNATFTALKDKNIYIPSYEAGDGSTMDQMPEYLRKELQNACGISDDDINKVLDSMWDDLSSGKPLDNAPLWTVQPTTYVVGTYTKAIVLSLVGTITVVVFFEIARGIFYYIIVGSFFPDSPKKYLAFKRKQKTRT
jgi:hypothetical protein